MALNSQTDKLKSEISSKADQFASKAGDYADKAASKASDYADKASSKASDLASKADTVKDQLTGKVQAFGEELIPMVKDQYAKIADAAGEATEDVQTWIKANPLKSIAIGVGLGWVTGMLVMRAFRSKK